MAVSENSVFFSFCFLEMAYAALLIRIILEMRLLEKDELWW